MGTISNPLNLYQIVVEYRSFVIREITISFVGTISTPQIFIKLWWNIIPLSITTSESTKSTKSLSNSSGISLLFLKERANYLSFVGTISNLPWKYRFLLSARICRGRMAFQVVNVSGIGAALMAFMIILMMAPPIHGCDQTGPISSSETRLWERQYGKFVITLWRFWVVISIPLYIPKENTFIILQDVVSICPFCHVYQCRNICLFSDYASLSVLSSVLQSVRRVLGCRDFCFF